MASSEAQERNLELARTGLAAWISGDREQAIATFIDDIEVYVPPELGNAGTYRGLEQFMNWFAAWDEAWSSFSMSVESTEAVGERHVVAIIRSMGVGAGSGIEVENTLAWVLGIRDDQMEYLSLQPDLEHALGHVSERDSAAS